MYGKVKLSKRQIKEDKFATFMLSSKHHVVDNWQFIVIGIVAVILIVVAIGYYADSQEAKRQASADMFARALMDYRSGNRQVAVTSLNQILLENSNNMIGEQALFLVGQINYELRNYNEAVLKWEEYISKFKSNKLNYAAAIAGIAAAYENQGRYAEAADKFVEAYQAYEDGPLDGDYRFGAMRCYLYAGAIEDARREWEQISELYPETGIYKRATWLFEEKSRS